MYANQMSHYSNHASMQGHYSGVPMPLCLCVSCVHCTYSMYCPVAQLCLACPCENRLWMAIRILLTTRSNSGILCSWGSIHRQGGYLSWVFYRIDQRGKCTMYIMCYMSVLPVFEGFRSHFEYPWVVFPPLVYYCSLTLSFVRSVAIIKCLLFFIIIMCVD